MRNATPESLGMAPKYPRSRDLYLAYVVLTTQVSTPPPFLRGWTERPGRRPSGEDQQPARGCCSLLMHAFTVPMVVPT